MRILHFYKNAYPHTLGGIEFLINQIAKGCCQYGIETDVLALTPDKMPRTILVDGYRVHHARRHFQIASTGFSASVFWRFWQLAKQVDLIHYHFPWPFMDVVHFATRVKKPTVLTYHSDIIRQKRLLALYRPLQFAFLDSVDSIVATSPNYLATSEVLLRYRDKVRVIPIGLDKASYPIVSTDKLAQWRNTVGEHFFLFVGVLRYYKGLHILLEALKDTDYPVVIVGAGPIENDLKTQANRLGLMQVRFLGELSETDKIALIQLSRAVVFPSHLRSEAFGISLLEGAMYAKPMISSEIGTGTTFVNLANETGLVVPPSDPIALRQALQYLWAHPKEAQEMGERAQARYEQYFTSKKMVEAYLDLYQSLVSRHL